MLLEIPAVKPGRTLAVAVVVVVVVSVRQRFNK